MALPPQSERLFCRRRDMSRPSAALVRVPALGERSVGEHIMIC
jgi:hypothetical protein